MKLCDFGLAKEVLNCDPFNVSKAKHTADVGNVDYMAPEAQTISLPLVDPKSDEILVKNLFVGINATDLNITAGRYFKHDDPPIP
ncbi:unnamed protein product [Oppiella nova]|uniref:Protein kinase domain-containing protein n=1 Tax=Oppiella nova TaxID=334625 RepID=A0A7R9M764_9ACAR|nr:unnamed protein product [Oppiella nova]CAG2172056.1 unnamed protein product [Oppiella nova]